MIKNLACPCVLPNAVYCLPVLIQIIHEVGNPIAECCCCLSFASNKK